MAEHLYEKLKKNATAVLPMHMPGHKRNLALSGEDGYLSALCADCDITEIYGFDNLAEPEEILLELKRRAAKLWKSEETYPLVNGSTCGILASIYATVKRGDSVIMARNCHKSVYNGMELVGASVTYLLPEQENITGTYGSITRSAVETAFEKAPEAKLVIVTSPTYEGIISDMEEICKATHAHGVPVLVDSAHGAHLGFGGFPKSAVECGADLVVQSLHKTMPCLTQTAFLHRNGKLVSAEKLQSAINLFQTSSPSYLLLASIDGCVGLLEEKEEELFAGWQEALSEFYNGAKLLQNIRVMDKDVSGKASTNSSTNEAIADSAVFETDPSKIVICTLGTDLTGTSLMEKLRSEYQIELEMAAEQYAIAMTGMGDTRDSLAGLLKALLIIDAQCGKGRWREMMYPKLPTVRMQAAEALTVPASECRWSEAVGRIIGEYVWAYPPGIPILVPGEELSEEMVAFIRQKEEKGVRIHRTGGKNGDVVRCFG